MKTYTVTLTLSIRADNEDDALEEFADRMADNAFDGDSIEIEEEEPEDL